jgi:hypothetical protein
VTLLRIRNVFRIKRKSLKELRARPEKEMKEGDKVFS